MSPYLETMIAAACGAIIMRCITAPVDGMGPWIQGGAAVIGLSAVVVISIIGAIR